MINKEVKKTKRRKLLRIVYIIVIIMVAIVTLGNYSAFDYTMPTVSITKIGNTFYAITSDDVGVVKVEWYIDGVYKGNGTTCAVPRLSDTLPHLVEARAYYYEEDVRSDMPHESITGLNTLTIHEYGSGFLMFGLTTTRTLQNGLPMDIDPVFSDILDKLPQPTFVADHMFTITNMDSDSLIQAGVSEKTQFTDATHNDKTSVHIDTISIDDNTDLYFIGTIFGAVDAIDFVDEDGKIAASKNGVYAAEYRVASDLPAGDYALVIRKSYEASVPYRIVIFAVPSKPELNLPRFLSDTEIEINNPYANKLIVKSDDKQYTVKPHSTISIPLNQGDNNLTYYSERKGNRSKSITNTILVDSIPPVVIIESAELINDMIMIGGTISESVSDFTINGETIMLGEFNPPGEALPFGHYFLNADINTLNIEAIDYYGNSFNKKINIIR